NRGFRLCLLRRCLRLFAPRLATVSEVPTFHYRRCPMSRRDRGNSCAGSNMSGILSVADRSDTTKNTTGSRPHSPAPFLASGALGAIVLVTAQLYYFVKLQWVIAGQTGIAFWLSVAFGTSFLLFCWIAAVRYVLMMFCAYFGWADSVRPVARPARWPRV